MRALRIASIVAAALAGASLATAAAAISPAWADMADGALQLDDQPTALTHAYVIEVNEIPEMHFGEGPTRYLSVMLTDRPFPDGQKPSEMTAHQLSFTGSLRGIGFDVDPATGEVMSGRTLLPEAERPQYFTVITMGAEPMVVLEDWAEADGRLHGHVRTPEPLEVVNFDGGPGPTAFTFEANFEATIIPAPKVTGTLDGAAATESPQAEALRRFVEAIASRDLEQIKAALATGDPMRESLTTEDVEMMNSMMFGDGSDAAGVLADLTKVYVFDDGSAVVVLQHGDSGTTTFPMADDNGTWKMGQP
jgi:hypothetical protein